LNGWGFIATRPDPVLRRERRGQVLAAADSSGDCEAEADSAVLSARPAAPRAANRDPPAWERDPRWP